MWSPRSKSSTAVQMTMFLLWMEHVYVTDLNYNWTWKTQGWERREKETVIRKQKGPRKLSTRCRNCGRPQQLLKTSENTAQHPVSPNWAECSWHTICLTHIYYEQGKRISNLHGQIFERRTSSSTAAKGGDSSMPWRLSRRGQDMEVEDSNIDILIICACRRW